MTGVLVLITGPGRSGTSTMAGALHHLGLYVPGPFILTNESNPKGFYESQWAMRFHKRIFEAAEIHDFDSRPWAVQRVREALTPDDREELVGFLRSHAREHHQVVVKDPRSAWVHQLWKDAAQEADLDIRYLSMMRHPAEVVGSRLTYYSSDTDVAARQRYLTFNVARWINGSLVNELNTREERRAFVPYLDMLGDWRTTLRSVQDTLGLTFDVDLASTGRHPVDDFIDPALRRHEATWDDLQVPPALQTLAEEVWRELCGMQQHPDQQAERRAAVDRLRVRYETLFDESAAVVHDRVLEARAEGRAEGRETGLKEGRKRGIAEGRKRGQAEGRSRAEQAARVGGRADTAAVPADTVARVPGRHLLSELGRRALGRARQRLSLRRRQVDPR